MSHLNFISNKKRPICQKPIEKIGGIVIGGRRKGIGSRLKVKGSRFKVEG